MLRAARSVRPASGCGAGMSARLPNARRSPDGVHALARNRLAVTIRVQLIAAVSATISSVLVSMGGPSRRCVQVHSIRPAHRSAVGGLHRRIRRAV